MVSHVILFWRKNKNLNMTSNKFDVILISLYFFHNIITWYIVRKLSSCTFRIAIEPEAENEAAKTYFRFSKVTWPARKWGIVTREVRIVRKSFYILFRWENRGFVGFLFIFLPKFDRKVVKNEKNQKKAIAFFSEDVYIWKMANHKNLILCLN